MSHFDWSSLKYHTGGNPSVRTGYMAEVINRSSIAETINDTIVTVCENPIKLSIFPDEFRYPVVININGVATNGKDTFTKLVTEESKLIPGMYSVVTTSLIDPVRPVVASLIAEVYNEADGMEQYHRNKPANIRSVQSVESDKDDAYRDFLHAVKNAWSAYYDGPVLKQFLKIVDICDKSRKSCTTLDYTTSIIFVNNRDVDTVETMKKACYACGIPCLTLTITGKSGADDWTNQCDHNTLNVKPDIVIDNSGTVDELRMKARTFATLFRVANYIYGVRRDEKDPNLNIPGIHSDAIRGWVKTLSPD